MKKIGTIIFITIFFGAFLARVYKIDNPIADWHSWRQADTSAVTRNFLRFGYNPFIPRYDDLSNIQTGQDNPQGYRMVEFPLYNSISYLFIRLAGNSIFTIEIWQRLVSIFASLFSLYFIYKLTSHFASKTAGLAASFFFAFLPYSIYYSRVILPEPTMVCLALGSLYFFTLWIMKKGNLYLLISALLGAGALLVKPFAVFFFPVYLLLVYQTCKLNKKTIVLLTLYGMFVITPFILWRSWISHYPEGIPAYEWLFNQNNIRFKSAFFYWIFAERIGKLILGYVGSFFLLLGIIFQSKGTNTWFFHVLGISMLLYLTIFAGGNVQHDYYQTMIIPVLSMYCGLGVGFLYDYSKGVSFKVRALLVGIVVVLFTLAFSWYQIRTYYWVNNPVIVEAGKKAQSLLPEDAKVIAPYGGDTAFLYQTGHQGWPQGFEIEDKVKKGATHYISVTPTDAEVLYVKSKYPVLFENADFIILTLQ
jgi:hypothetical protein